MLQGEVGGYPMLESKGPYHIMADDTAEIHIYRKDGSHLCIVNVFEFDNGAGAVDVIPNDNMVAGALLFDFKNEGRPVISETAPRYRYFHKTPGRLVCVELKP